MILLLSAMTSFGLIIFGGGLIVLTLRDSGSAVLAALAGEVRFIPVQSVTPARRVVRIRMQSVAPVQLMRAAA
jgi:hypothetical protein